MNVTLKAERGGLMETIEFDYLLRTSEERRERAIKAVRKVNPDFVPGTRHFDRPRKNKDKQKLLDAMRVKENEIQYR